MRQFLALIFLIPTFAFADQIQIYAPVTHVVVHPEGATVTRRVDVKVPAGEHTLILPATFDAYEEIFTLDVFGVQKGPVWVSRSDSPLPEALESELVKAARENVDNAENALQNLQDQKKSLLLPKADGDARLQFLGGLSEGDGIAQLNAEQLANLVDVIGQESRAATQMSDLAEIEARKLDKALEEAEDALSAADLDLAKQIDPNGIQQTLSVEITAAADTSAQLELRYLVSNTGWYTFNELHLDRGENSKATLKRNVFVRQFTEESWREVTLVLSTGAPFNESDPGVLFPIVRRIQKPEPTIDYKVRNELAAAPMSLGEPMIEAPVVMEEAAMISSYDGLAVEYIYPEKVTIERSDEPLQLPLPTLELSIENLFAQATPDREETAFLVANLKNETETPILDVHGATMLFLNGTLVGNSPEGNLASGESKEFGFGSIDGIRIASTVLNDNSGDRGIIRGSKIQSQQRRFDIENFTPETWDIRLYGQVPYSIQEDLKIEWDASPAPDVIDVDDKRGIMQWDLTVATQEKTEVTLTHKMTWPEDYELR